MKDTLNVGHRASVELVRPAKPASDKLEPHGLYHVEHWRGGKLLATYEAPNYITDEGRTALLGVMFHSVTQITSYWMGLVDSVSFTAYAQADAYGQLAGTNGWRENTAYTDDLNSGSSSTRPVWTSGAVSVTSHVAAVANSTASVFDITATGTIKGLFLVGGNSICQTKGDHTSGSGATLWSAAAFTSGDVAVQSGDQLKITYSVTA